MIRTKYIKTKSKECADDNEILVSIGSDDSISIVHMKDMKAILLYPDQVKEFLSFRNKKRGKTT